MNETTAETNSSVDLVNSTKLNTLKWGEALNDGFVMIPAALLRHQHKLKLSSGEMVVLLNLLMSWWRINENPHIQSATIAGRMKTSTRTVQRHIESLENKGLIKRIWTKHNQDDRAGASYDLSAVVSTLKELGKHAHSSRTTPI